MNRAVMSIGCMLALLVLILVLSRAAAVENFELSPRNAMGIIPQLSATNVVDNFDNTGGLMNLASTRVLTAGEARAERKAYAEQVEHDLADMTE